MKHSGYEDLITVIVPVYNVEKYLNRCMESLIQQTYDNLEIIMIDDGSRDNSGMICDEYAKKYHNCKVFHKSNEGLGMARNTGLENMSGDYVTFVDSDDWVSSDLIEKLYEGLAINQVDVCKGGFRHVRDDGAAVSVVQYKNEVFKGQEAKEELLPRMIGSCPAKHDSVEMCVCGALYQVAPIKRYNIRFPSERVLISEDLVFNIDYMQHANGACTIENTDYQYRMNNNSLTTSYRPDRFQASTFFYLEMKKKLQNLDYDENTFLRLKRMFFIYVRMSISQETKTISQLTFKENKENIKKICDNEILRDVIRNYPINKLGLKQRFFLKLIDNKAINSLCFLAKFKLI